MYLDFFDFRRRPFPLTVDLDSYMETAGHEHARKILTQSVHDSDGISILTAESGLGKTMIARLLAVELDKSMFVICLQHSQCDGIAGMLKSILYDVSITIESNDLTELRLRIIDTITSRFRDRKRTVLIVDEAHLLTIEQLQELRLLTNLEGGRERAFHAILFGDSKLEATLQHPELNSLLSRVAVRVKLPAMSEEESLEYVRLHMNRAGADRDAVFTADALSELVALSRGNPRRISQLCHRSLACAKRHDLGTVDAEVLEQAHAELMWEIETARLDPRGERSERHHPLPTPTLAHIEPVKVVPPQEEEAEITVVEIGGDDGPRRLNEPRGNSTEKSGRAETSGGPMFGRWFG